MPPNGRLRGVLWFETSPEPVGRDGRQSLQGFDRCPRPRETRRMFLFGIHKMFARDPLNTNEKGVRLNHNQSSSVDSSRILSRSEHIAVSIFPASSPSVPVSRPSSPSSPSSLSSVRPKAPFPSPISQCRPPHISPMSRSC